MGSPIMPSKRMVLRKRINLTAFMLILITALVFTLGSMSCSPKIVAKPTTTAVVSTPRPTAAPVITPTTPKVTTTPTLTQTSFTLLLTSPETYTEYTLPIYLSSQSTIHLVWTVSGVGEHIRMAINVPGGQLVGVKAAGGFVNMTSDAPCDQLNRSGSIVLKPSDQNWASGYYIFHPYICNNDPTVAVKILYWIEQ